MFRKSSALALGLTVAATALCVAAAQTPAPATPNVWQVPPADPGPRIPEGITQFFNAKDLTG